MEFEALLKKGTTRMCGWKESWSEQKVWYSVTEVKVIEYEIDLRTSEFTFILTPEITSMILGLAKVVL